MPKEKYKLIFRLDQIRAFIVEMLMRGGYDNLTYIYSKPLGEAYISYKNQNILAKEGIRLYVDRKKIKNMIREGWLWADKIREIGAKINNTDLGSKTNPELKRIFERIYSYGLKFLKIYSFTEVFYSPLIDKTIRKFVHRKIEDDSMANLAFATLLNPSVRKKVIEEREKILMDVEAPQKIKNLCESVREVGKEKLLWRIVLNKGLESIIAILHEIAKRNYLAINQIESCLHNEVMDLLDGKEINLDEINERTKCFATIKGRSKSSFYVDRPAQKIISKIKRRLNAQIKEFRGDIASPGIARGMVKIFSFVVTKEEKEILKMKMRKMRKGDILVATTTGPEMIIACRKAGAIVAEEGGINSHAAIISRELGIPGIVNTGIATQILKDGDLIEVNANRGIVKILKKRI